MLIMDLVIALPALLCAAAPPEASSAPWETNEPIVNVRREVYRKAEDKGAGPWVDVHYVGPGTVREEIHTRWAESDTPRKPLRRRSSDNGHTWSEFEPMPEIVSQVGGQRVLWTGGPQFYDAEHKVIVSIWLHQPYLKGQHYNHCFSRTSHDLGLTWNEPRLLRYESGDDLDPANPFQAGFLQPNQAYFGSNVLRLSDGTLVHCVAEANDPGDPPKDRSVGRNASLCFLGTWDADARNYRWSAGQRVVVSREVSSRGLLEPCVAQLKDSRVLVIWRGSDTPTTPGRKWFSLSTDGGRTLTNPAELKYDDGSSFYSPSSFHLMLRHSVTDKLYWIGNLSSNPPSGNSPRYPLVIAEIEETIPALKRKTVTRIDDRAAEDSPRLQLSNFSLLEDQETHTLEIYLTRIGEDAADFWHANAYKYTVTLR